MPRKWIRDEQWQRQPHVKEGPPASLWWYRRPDRHLVVAAYVAQCKRGRALPEDFKDNVVQWLDDLSRGQYKKAWGQPRTFRYWSIPAYALANGMESPSLMKRLREMEKIAKQKFPDSVPASRKRAPLTEKETKSIKRLYRKGADAKELAEKFRITPAHVGRLCIEEKAIRAAEREQAENKMLGTENVPPAAPDRTEYPF